MARARLIYSCTDCGAVHPKWAGQCATCAAWNTLVEEVEQRGRGGLLGSAPPALAQQIAAIPVEAGVCRPTGLAEVDRVLGGGLVPGSVTLLGGEPGVGKSTLLLQLLDSWPGRALYVSAEESAQQVRLRAERLEAIRDELWLLSETNLAHIAEAIDSVQPSLVVIDSIQAVADAQLGSAPGSVVQVRGCAHQLVALAKQRGIPMVLVGHVTKEGNLAGPRQLEHLVDTVLSFEGDRHHALRLLRAVKHRFGPTNELGVFEMVGAGLAGVPDASSLFLSDRRTGVPGSAVTPTLDGSRPLLVEVQALANMVNPGVTPRRSAQGIDGGRLALLLAVLERRARVKVGQYEVYASSVGGVKLTEPGADLATCMAIVSTVGDRPIAPDVVMFGEVGLAGELRQVSHAARRLTEAARIGFRRAIVPANSANGVDGIQVIRCATINEAISALGLTA